MPFSIVQGTILFHAHAHLHAPHDDSLFVNIMTNVSVLKNKIQSLHKFQIQLHVTRLSTFLFNLKTDINLNAAREYLNI